MTTTLDRLTAALADRYRVDRELGAGGMATVYLAHDLRHERDVAIKVLHPDLGAALGAERFLSEIKTTAKLQHPHILPLLDSGAADGLLYYVMPYVRGEALRARLSRGAIPLAEAVELLRNVLQALQHAHAAGIVHRDIKPENILLTAGAATVADFGVAKALSTSRTVAGHVTLTQAGTAVGTPAYMAPEQAAGDPHTDARADLYAWGLVAYEVLTGRHPFARHVTPQAIITAHLTEAPVPLVTANPALPAPIAEAVMACLAKAPDERPADAGVVLGRLDVLRTPSAMAAPRPTRRWPTRSVVLASVAVLVAMAAAGWFLRGRPAAAAGPPSVAVLPFDIGTDTANAYVADGLSAELVTRLAQLPGLVVRAYSSSARLRGQDPGEAARQLGVQSVVTASVRRANDLLHVNASLVSAADARVLWSESFDGRDADQFALQARLAEAIARALQVRLTAEARTALAVVGTRDPVAHDLVQRARFLMDQLTPGAVDAAIGMASDAIARDSSYVDAWLTLVQGYVYSADDVKPGAAILEPAGRAIRRAKALAPESPDVLAMSGMFNVWYARDTAAGGAELRRALARDSTSAVALIPYAALVDLTDPDSAGRLVARAVRLNPNTTLSLYFTIWAPQVFRVLPADSGRMACERLGTYVPALGYGCEASRLAQFGRTPEAVAAWRRIDTTTFVSPSMYAWRALAAANIGDTALIRSALASAERAARLGYVREDNLMLATARIGDREATLRLARAALTSHAAGAFYVWGRRFDAFRDDPEFRALRRAGADGGTRP